MSIIDASRETIFLSVTHPLAPATQGCGCACIGARR